MDSNGILREWTSQIKDNLTICEQEDLADILYSFGIGEIKTKNMNHGCAIITISIKTENFGYL